MGPNIVIDPFPFSQLLIELLQITFRRMKGIKFVQMRSVHPFPSYVGFPSPSDTILDIELFL